MTTQRARTESEMLQKCAAMMKAGDFANAAKILATILQRTPQQPDALQLQGLILRRQGDSADAIDCFRRSLRANPAQPHVWNNLGNTLASQQNYVDAIAAYQEALKRAPEYAEAMLNMGLAQIAMQDPGAVDILKKAIVCSPQNAAIWIAYGRALRANNNFAQAIDAFQRALALKPGDLSATHNLAVAMRLSGQAEKALPMLEACAAIAPQKAEIHYNLGHCYFDLNRLDDALGAYERSIEEKPDFRAAHDTLNRLYWEHNRLDRHLMSYETAVRKHPLSAGLWADWAHRLSLTGDTEAAIALLKDALTRGADSGELQHRLGQALIARQSFDEGLKALSSAVAREPENNLFRHDYARGLIAAGRSEQAVDTLAPVLHKTPFDQQALAYTGLAWKALNDPRNDELNDYDRFVKATILPPPPGYDSIEAFNERLETVLTRLHISSRHPLEQTLRGGSQTMGKLFDLEIEEIDLLRNLFRDAVADYIADLPAQTGHPFLGRLTRDFGFSGSWSVRLQRQGFHLNHVHPEGWISSSYYVALPTTASTGAHEGAIKFGESSLALGGFDRSEKIIQPRSGMLVLFPSYFYHGTIPFESRDHRMTVAFDVAPE